MDSYNDTERVRHACRTWPAEQQERWIALMAPDDILEEPAWKPVTQLQYAGVYTRYLAACGPLSADGVRRWIRELEQREIAQRTISGYLWAIQQVIRKVTDQDIRWFTRTCSRVQVIADQTMKKKIACIAPAEAIFQFGLETIARAKAMGPNTWKATQLFRDGLFLVFGLCVPERRRALVSTRIEALNRDTLMTNYRAEVVKTGKPSIRTYPALVGALLAEWIDSWRARYVRRGHDHGHLWIAKGGKPAVGATIYTAMRKLTTAAPWGFPITPNRLRDAAATILVETSPETARLATILLDHSSERMTRNYTETAERIEASRQGQAMIAQGREDAGRRAREAADTGGTILLHPRAKARRKRSARPSNPNARVRH